MDEISGIPGGYVTAAEAAGRIGVSRRTIARWIEAGRIPGAKRQRVPGGFRFLVSARTADRMAREAEAERKADAALKAAKVG